MKKSIVLCADDFGQAPAISAGILALVAAKRLSATSCLVTMPGWAEKAQALRVYQDQIDIGLHLNFTDGEALSTAYREQYGANFFSLKSVLKRAMLRQWQKDIIKAESHAQLDAFAKHMGRLPDYIDGHQHVHQFPIFRDALCEVYQERFPTKAAYIRWVNEPINGASLGEKIKKIIIHAMGTKAFKQLLMRYHIPHNLSFGGIYSLNKSTNFAQSFQRFLTKIGNQGIIMCHPGLPAKDKNDPINDTRAREFTYLMSEAFLSDCVQYQIEIKRFSQC